MSKVLVISTSLRAKSNSDILTDRMIAGAKNAGHEVEHISLTKIADIDLAGYPERTLAGAVFGIYSDAQCSTEVQRITTDASGQATSTALIPGIYYV